MLHRITASDGRAGHMLRCCTSRCIGIPCLHRCAQNRCDSLDLLAQNLQIIFAEPVTNVIPVRICRYLFCNQLLQFSVVRVDRCCGLPVGCSYHQCRIIQYAGTKSCMNAHVQFTDKELCEVGHQGFHLNRTELEISQAFFRYQLGQIAPYLFLGVGVPDVLHTWLTFAVSRLFYRQSLQLLHQTSIGFLATKGFSNVDAFFGCTADSAGNLFCNYTHQIACNTPLA